MKRIFDFFNKKADAAPVPTEIKSVSNLTRLNDALKTGDLETISTMVTNNDLPSLDAEKQWECLRMACNHNDERILTAMLSAYPDAISHQGVSEDTFQVTFAPKAEHGNYTGMTDAYLGRYYFKSQLQTLRGIESSAPYKDSCLSIASRNSNPKILEVLNAAIEERATNQRAFR